LYSVIALLDGPRVDDGTAWEIACFYAKRSPEKKIIGVRTDFRRAGESECDMGGFPYLSYNIGKSGL
jgi:nucleoside 2-deoxyribosyltransferase